MITQDEQNIRQLIKTLRASLNLVDLDDLRKVAKPESEKESHNMASRIDEKDRKEYVGRMSGYWINGLRQEIEVMIYEQEKFLNMLSQNHEQDMIGRGTLNGLLLVFELYEAYEQEWKALQEENK